MEETKKPICFVIMPFGGLFDVYYDQIYCEAINEARFDSIRADDLYRPGNIMNDIWEFTKSCDIILADLTTKNPNVFYELGLAHAISKPAILITSSMDDVPFDLRSLRVIVFDKNLPDWGFLLKEKIINALKETLKNPKAAIPPTFIKITKSEVMEVSEYEMDILSLKNDIDYIKTYISSETHPISSYKTLYDGETVFRLMQTIGDFDRQNLTKIDIMEKLEALGFTDFNQVNSAMKIYYNNKLKKK